MTDEETKNRTDVDVMTGKHDRYPGLKIKEVKVARSEKPRLYKKVQKMLEGVKTSLAEDIVSSRIEEK